MSKILANRLGTFCVDPLPYPGLVSCREASKASWGLHCVDPLPYPGSVSCGQLWRGQQSVLGPSLASISWLIPVGSLAERPAKRCRMITKISDPEHCFSNFQKERQSTTGARLSRVSLLLQKAAAFKALAVSGSLAGWAAAALARPSGARAGGLSTKSCVPSAAPLPSVLPLCLSFRPPLPLYPAPFLSPAIPIMMGGQARARLTQLVLRIHLRLRSSTLVLEKPQRSE